MWSSSMVVQKIPEDSNIKVRELSFTDDGNSSYCVRHYIFQLTVPLKSCQEVHKHCFPSLFPKQQFILLKLKILYYFLSEIRSCVKLHLKKQYFATLDRNQSLRPVTQIILSHVLRSPLESTLFFSLQIRLFLHPISNKGYIS